MSQAPPSRAQPRQRARAAVRRGPRSRASSSTPDCSGMLAALAVIWIGFNVLSGGLFLTPRNLWNLSVQTASVAIMATGMVLIIVSRNIDLSIGSSSALTGMTMAMLQAEWIPKAFGLGFDQPWTWIVDPGRRARPRRRSSAAPGLRHRLRRRAVVHRHARRAARLARPRLPARAGPDDRPARHDLPAARRRARGLARRRTSAGSWPASSCAAIVYGLITGRRRRRRYGFPLRPMLGRGR